MTKKLKHGSRIISYSYSDYSDYRHGEQYIHPQIHIQRATIVCSLAEYKSYGYESSLKTAQLLRDETKDTLHVSLSAGFGNTITVKWQSDRQYNDGVAFYPELYGCRIDSCGFDSDTIAIALKLSKQCHDWSTSPLLFVDALKSIGAVCTRYDRKTDCHLVCEHLTDNMFFLPDHLRRKPSVAA
jgi:hypothetical protein